MPSIVSTVKICQPDWNNPLLQQGIGRLNCTSLVVCALNIISIVKINTRIKGNHCSFLPEGLQVAQHAAGDDEIHSATQPCRDFLQRLPDSNWIKEHHL